MASLHLENQNIVLEVERKSFLTYFCPHNNVKHQILFLKNLQYMLFCWLFTTLK